MGTASRAWIEQTVDTGDETIPVLTQQVDGRLVAVPARPLLARGPTGRPKLSLTLGLSRRPAVDEPSLTPLVTYGLLGFTATVALPADVSTSTFGPLFVRSAVFRLSSQDAITLQDIELQRVQSAGGDASAAFSLALDRAGALQALAAVRGSDTNLTVCCTLDHQQLVAAEPRRLRLSGSYGSVYEALSRYGSLLDRSAIEAAVQDALGSGALTVQSAPSVAPLAQIVDAFLKIAGPILRPQDSLYSLRKPWSAAPFDMSVQLSAPAGNETLNLACKLETLLQGAFTEEDADQILQLIVPDEQGLPTALPRRVQQRATRDALQPLAAGAGRLAKLGSSAKALSMVARPQAANKLDARLQLQDSGTKLSSVISAGKYQWHGDDLSVLLPNRPAPARALPRVDDASAAYFQDYQSAELHWYAPEYVVEPAAPGGDPQRSPFLFVFRTSGHTATGEAGLDGSVRVRVRPGMSAQTLAAWQTAGQPKIAPVPALGLSASLSIPFRDQSGATRSQGFPATVTPDGDAYLVEVALLDAWLRLAYGALSTPGFQSAPATLSIFYTFEAYIPINQAEVSLVMDHKLASLQLYASDPIGPRADTYINTSDLTYNTPAAQLKFSRELRARAPISTKLHEKPDFVIRPDLNWSGQLPEIIAERRYGVQSIGRAFSQTLLYPCDSLGAFYLQELPDGSRQAIGCRDAFKLGQTEYKQYQRLSELDDPDYSVWRSLQQPGRFMLAPQRWAIARFAANDAERAYRPAIIVYSTLDPSVPENNRGALLASLIPDVPAAKWRSLERRLAALAQAPIVSLINELETETSYAWPLPESSGIEQRTVKLFDSFQVSLVCALDGIPQLQAMLQHSGLVGSVSYQLPDGTQLSAALSLDLNHIVGPAPNGPVEARLSSDGAECELINHIERAVDVSDLLAESAAGGELQSVRVEQRLESNASCKVALQPGAARATAVISLVPGTAAELTEIRSFVEDVHTNVAFISLINFANHGVTQLSLQARIRELPDTQSLTLSEAAPIGALEFVLPLTRYLADPVLEYAVTRAASDGTTSTSAWRSWSLATQGNVISLSWELIQ